MTYKKREGPQYSIKTLLKKIYFIVFLSSKDLTLKRKMLKFILAVILNEC